MEVAKGKYARQLTGDVMKDTQKSSIGKVAATGLWEGLKWWLTKGKGKLHDTRDDLKKVQLIALEILNVNHDSSDQLKGLAERAIEQQQKGYADTKATLDRLETKLDDYLYGGELEEDVQVTPVVYPEPVYEMPPRFGFKSITFNINNRNALVYAGPYNNKPSDIDGVKMAKEIDKPYTINVPTEDFNVPDRVDMYRGQVAAFILLYTKGELYVGCMGGIGRTGLFLAIMNKVWGMNQGYSHERWLKESRTSTTIEMLRKEVHPHAVETPEQKDYIDNFNAEAVAVYLRKVGIFS